MCNKLVAGQASASLIDCHYYQRDKAARGRERKSREWRQFWSSALLWSQLSAGLVQLRNTSNALETFLLNLNACHTAVKIFQCGLFGAPSLSTFLSLGFWVFGANLLCGLLMRSQYDGWLADCLSECLPVCLPPPPSFSFSVCLCVCVS